MRPVVWVDPARRLRSERYRACSYLSYKGEERFRDICGLPLTFGIYSLIYTKLVLAGPPPVLKTKGSHMAGAVTDSRSRGHIRRNP